MKSHSYQLSKRDWVRLLIAPAVAFVCLAALSRGFLQLAVGQHHSSAALTLDDVIIEEKSRLSRTKSSADIVFIGDSSCMMDLDLPDLRRTYRELNGCNLGSLSTLGLPRFTTFLRAYLETQGVKNDVQLAATAISSSTQNASPKLVVLLISPEMVRTAHQPVTRKRRNQEQERKHRELLAQTHVPSFDLNVGLNEFYDATSVSQLRTEVADRLIDHPLPGHWGERYGSFAGFRSYLSAHNGCAIDPSDRTSGPVAPPLRSPELDPAFIAQCHEFAQALPPWVKVAVGLTPIPHSEAEPGYRELIGKVLQQLQEALNANVALTNMPVTLPDSYFSTSTHLNHAGALQYTRYLGRALRQAGLTPSPSLAAKSTSPVRQN